ncbi:SET domain-containing protein SmydA-8 [Neodiprion lecontei]|uniref:Protein msta, isoform B-like n=1 Tax=Neodiprion lecontei TaxID=441921 RepID=A0A6J0BZY4_NEOLC|nr:SET domain-containing protein SmydA-8 [Neodiprion lecontei]XP_015519884.1 SET domain-containing protein SmydA-8 [Neodiprion lecontei]XP_015519885.1 SET domain-containing protein SmydA-8 [Neodiprion lecontei]
MGSDNVEGACAICEKLATLRCSNCKAQFYCTKQHQKDDWSRHKTACRSWEIRENRELGRHLLAARDLDAGDLVVCEPPLVWGPVPHSLERVCVGCGSRQAHSRCPGCTWPACSPRCLGLTDHDRHGTECAILAKCRILPRCDLLLPLRFLLLRRRSPKRWALLEALQCHDDSRGPGTEAHEEMLSLREHLAPFLAMDQAAADAFPRVCGLIDVNALETNPPEGSAALYETACLLEHNCIANTRHSFSIDAKGRPCITVRTVTAVQKGEHLSTIYTHALWATRSRREHLLATKYFSCRCQRCADPTELGTYLGTLVCPCGPGLVLPRDPLDSETEWFCNACPGILTSMEVMQLTERLGEEVEGAMELASRHALADLLSRLQVLLHPGHQHCLTVGHSLMQLLPPEEPQKAEICRRVIQTTQVLDPYGSRLALYTAVALRELSLCPGEDRLDLLCRATKLLKFEPPNSPGEKLLRLLKAELL